MTNPPHTCDSPATPAPITPAPATPARAVLGPAALGLLALATTACLPLPGGDPAAAPEPAPAASPEAPASPTAQDTTAPGGADQGGMAVWAVPVPSGWTVETFNENGVHSFTEDASGCRATLSQNMAASPDDRGTAAGTVDSYIDLLGAEVGDTVVTAQQPLGLPGPDGAVLDFETSRVDYTGNDGVDYTLTVSAQWVDDIELIFTHACESTRYPASGAGYDAFVEQLAVQRV
ncbi:hypothetical protein [Nocardiopsis changdeensis]|uniref:hypothetical protein n=1 Tax=Nocardiopsis changdeensis TaxID=2831969 RepID=UPI003F451ADB